MNIAIISPGRFSVPPVHGSSVEYDIDQVSRVLAKNHNVLIYSRISKHYPRSTGSGSLQYIRVPYRNGRSYLRKVIQDLRTRQVDAVLVENRPAYVPPLRKAFPGLPIVVNMHSHVYASPAMIAPSRMKQAVKKMDGMITNSHYLRNYYLKRHKVPPDRIHAVHLGIDIKLHQKRAEEWRRILRNRLGLSPEHRVLLYAGRMIREKGVHLLIKSFRKIARIDPDARLVLIGGTGYGKLRNTPYVKHLRQLAKPLGSRVIFVGFVPTRHMAKWYHVADVVATPSLWAEPFCRVNLEAMASGKQVLTTNRGGIPEVVADGLTGYCLPPEKWVRKVPRLWKKLWSSGEAGMEMGREAAARAQQFSWEATAAGYVEVLEKAVQRRNGSADHSAG